MTMLNKYELMAMAAGFLLGGLVSNIITEKVLEHKTNEKINKELDKIHRDSNHHETEEKPSKNDENKSDEPKSKFSESSIGAHDIDTHEVQYNTEVVNKDENYISKYGSYEAPIHIVTFEDCCDAPEGWKTEWLKWYSEDDVLTDESDDPVDFSLIGNATDNFDENVLGEDEDTIYVSNRNTMTIYEVRKINANYYEEVLGGISEWEDERLSGGREKIPKRKGKLDE